MRIWAVSAVVSALIFMGAAACRAQAGAEGPTFETIQVTGDRPVARAMDAIEKRYGVMIDYVDAPWVAPQNLQLYRSLHGKPLRVPYQGPKTWTITVHYWQVPGTPGSVAPIYRCNTATLGCAPVTTRPQEGIERLIQEVLHQFAEQGGQIFTVRRLQMPYGARWEVYPTYARDRSGTMVAQPDLLSTRISIPKARRWPGQMFDLIVQQLAQESGANFRVALTPVGGTFAPVMLKPGERPPKLEAEGVSAWRAIADLMGPRGTLGVLRVLYCVCEPDCGTEYGVSIVGLPYREPPRPPTPTPAPAKMLGMRRLWPSGPLVPVFLPAKPAMSAALLDWLNSTPDGRKDVQRALAEAGFYNGPINGHLYLPMRKALQAFQTAHGLKPTGGLDWATAVKLSPFLPQPQ